MGNFKKFDRIENYNADGNNISAMYQSHHGRVYSSGLFNSMAVWAVSAFEI